MARPKVMFLTTEVVELNDKGRDRIGKAVKKKFKRNLEDDDNPAPNTAKWYMNLGIPVPEGIEDEEEDDNDGLLELDDSEFNTTEKTVILERCDYSYTIGDEDGSVVYTADGRHINVVESPDMIYEQLRYIDQNIFERFIDGLKIKYYTIKYKLKNKI